MLGTFGTGTVDTDGAAGWHGCEAAWRWRATSAVCDDGVATKAQQRKHWNMQFAWQGTPFFLHRSMLGAGLGKRVVDAGLATDTSVTTSRAVAIHGTT